MKYVKTMEKIRKMKAVVKMMKKVVKMREIKSMIKMRKIKMVKTAYIVIVYNTMKKGTLMMS